MAAIYYRDYSGSPRDTQSLSRPEVYLNPRTGEWETVAQNRRIEALKEELEEKKERKADDLKSLIAHFYSER